MNFNREGCEGRDGIDPAGAKQDEGRLAGLAMLEQVDCAEEVVFNELAGAGFSVHTGEDTGICGGVDDSINLGNSFQIASRADVAVEDFDAERLELCTISFAAGTDEIIDSKDFQVSPMSQQGFGQRAANESANACDENFHGENRNLRSES